MLSHESWRLVAGAGLLLGALAGVTEGPWAAAAFTLVYGTAVLVLLRS